MSSPLLSKYQYHHAVSSKYRFSSLGFDLYQATFVSNLPRRPLTMAAGKWFINIRCFKWQVLINKMTKAQLEILMSSRQQVSRSQGHLQNSTLGF